MLTKLEVRNIQGSLLSLPLENVLTGYVIADISGLDPVKATVATSTSAQQDGVQVHSTRREARNIIVKLDLEPNYSVDTISDLRDRLYSFFMTESEVNLRFFMTDRATVTVVGIVESCEIPLFSSEPQADISILCSEPDFLGLDPVVLFGTSTSTTTETLVTYGGSVKTGLQFVLNVDRTLTEFTFYHRSPSGIIRSMDIQASLVAGDVLTISTVSGAKGATLLRSGTVSSLLYAVSPQSNYHELEKGDNYIRVYATGAAIPFGITYTTRYGGL